MYAKTELGTSACPLRYLYRSTGDDLPVNRRSEDTFMVRMLTFLPGKTLNELTVVPDNIFEEMGENLARVHTAFQVQYIH